MDGRPYDSDEVEVIEDTPPNSQQNVQVQYENIPIKPKNVSSAYIWFSGHYRKQNPGVATNQVMTEAGRTWTSMSEDDRKPFRAMEEKDKLRYTKELQELKTTGSFTNQDGVNSKDMIPKKRLVQHYGG